MTQPESGARVRSLSVQTLRGSRYSHGTPVCRQHDVASPASYLKIFRHPAHPKLTLTTTSLAVQAVPGTRIVVYRPTDEVTRIAIGKLLTGDGADEHFPCWETHQQREAGLAAS